MTEEDKPAPPLDDMPATDVTVPADDKAQPVAAGLAARFPSILKPPVLSQLVKPIALPSLVSKPLLPALSGLVNTRLELPRLYSDAINRAIGDWLVPMQESFRQIGQLIRQVQTEWAPVVQSLRPVFQAMASIDWDAWWAAQRNAFLAAAKDGWFIQPEMGANVVSLEANGELPEGFEPGFVAALTVELDSIEARLLESFPERAHLIKEGFALHREKRYYSAIPMFLNCAEGIVQEATNLSPFNTQGAAPEVAEWTKRLPLERLNGMLADALTVKHPLSQHSGDSRHRINHGRSIDYGTEVSSLKALSFLGFAGWLFCPNDGPLAKAAEKAGWERTSRGWKPRHADKICLSSNPSGLSGRPKRGKPRDCQPS